MDEPHINSRAASERMGDVNDMNRIPNGKNRRHCYTLVAACTALVISGAIGLAQAPAKTAASPASDAPDLNVPTLRVAVNNLVAPVLVTDQQGNIIDGLQDHQFHLYDNGIEQNIHVD